MLVRNPPPERMPTRCRTSFCPNCCPLILFCVCVCVFGSVVRAGCRGCVDVSSPTGGCGEGGVELRLPACYSCPTAKVRRAGQRLGQGREVSGGVYMYIWPSGIRREQGESWPLCCLAVLLVNFVDAVVNRVVAVIRVVSDTGTVCARCPLFAAAAYRAGRLVCCLLYGRCFSLLQTAPV